MNLQKRTYSIDRAVLTAFESAVETGSRSVVVTELLRHYLADRERETIRRQIIEGSKQLSALYVEESNAWNPLEEELLKDELYEREEHRPAPRRRGAGASRSGRRTRASGRSSGARTVTGSH